MRRRAAAAGGSLATIAALLYALSLSVTSYAAFAPAVRHECRRQIGMAWSPGALVDRARRDFCAPRYFHSASDTARWYNDGGIPVIRPDAYIQQLARLMADGYSGDVLLLNEPDRPDQDNVPPEEAARLYAVVVLNLPAARVVAPNAIDLAYLDAFLAAVGSSWRQTDAIGIHIYQPGDPPRPVTWPAAWYARAHDVMVAHGIKSALWVSEVGPSNAWQADDLARYYRELLDGPAEWIFIYTPHCGGYNAHACRRNLYTTADGDALTASGRALQRAMVGAGRGYP